MSFQYQALNHTLNISDVKWIQKKKRKFKPGAIEESFTQEFGTKPATIRSYNESEFVIEILNEK